VERLLAAVRARLKTEHQAQALRAVARGVIADERERLGVGSVPGDRRPAPVEPRSIELLADAVVAQLAALAAGHDLGGDRHELRPAINATGVILHTNLGRAPWPAAAIQAATRAAGSYSLLELDPVSGRRGPRFRAAEAHLIALTGAQDALIVNNNATAVALAVGLAGRRGVAVSRGELVEIGGGVRIPEIIRRAGASLVEVGTTNRTRVEDFRDPLESGRAAMVLRVHPSNFRQSGFVAVPDAAALAEVAHAHGATVVDDLGSGALLETRDLGLPHEVTPAEALAAGADLVTFSGDKLVGGPQAGLIVGRADLVARLRRDPLARATRPDKVLLAAVAATLGLYRAGLARREIPVWRMVGTPVEALRARAARLAADAGPGARVGDLTATLGGGSLPGEGIPSAGVVLSSASPDRLLAVLRAGDPAVVGRIEAGEVVLDLRTVDPADDPRLATALRGALRARVP
jgi:L-seryl-tRNA(Ser) seleniumtransferase